MYQKEEVTSAKDSDALKNVRMERVVLGILLIFPQYSDDICSLLPDEAFSDDELRLVFTACRDLNSRGERIDFIAVGNEIRRKHNGLDLDFLLINLTKEISSGADWEIKCRVLQEVYFKRRLFYNLLETTPKLKAFDVDVFDVMEDIQSGINEIDDIARRNTHARDFSDILDDNEEQLFKRMKCFETGTMPGINTGISSVNRATMGWQNSDLCILAGRPSMGKTAIALHFAKTAAEYGSNVVFFSLEMSDVRLARRLILSGCDVPAEAVKSGDLTPMQVNQFLAAKNGLKRLPITIVEKAGIDIGELYRTAKSLRRRKKCDLVIVDYLQLVTVGTTERVGNREQEVALVSRKLKALAKDLNIPVIALAQLSREVENSAGGDKRHIPSLRHLRESGAIEQDADMVSFVYRPSYYGIENWDDGNPTAGRGFIYIAKHRDGELGTCEFRHNDAMTKIFDPPTYQRPNINDFADVWHDENIE